jgi:hypothetical protein
MVIPYYHHYGKDVGLYCVEDSPQRVFWTYWGDTAFDTPPMERYASGVSNCKRPHLVGHALNDTRMEVLQDLVRPLELGTLQMQPRPVPTPGEASTESVKRGTPTAHPEQGHHSQRRTVAMMTMAG